MDLKTAIISENPAFYKEVGSCKETTSYYLEKELKSHQLEALKKSFASLVKISSNSYFRKNPLKGVKAILQIFCESNKASSCSGTLWNHNGQNLSISNHTINQLWDNNLPEDSFDLISRLHKEMGGDRYTVTTHNCHLELDNSIGLSLGQELTVNHDNNRIGKQKNCYSITLNKKTSPLDIIRKDNALFFQKLANEDAPLLKQALSTIGFTCKDSTLKITGFRHENQCYVKGAPWLTRGNLWKATKWGGAAGIGIISSLAVMTFCLKKGKDHFS